MFAIIYSLTLCLLAGSEQCTGIIYPFIFFKRVFIGVLVVCGEGIAADELPSGIVDGREKSVSIGERMTDARYVQTVGIGQQLLINLPATDDENLILQRQYLLNASHHFRSFKERSILPGKDYIAAVRQRTARQGQIGAAAHHDRMPGGESLEMLQVSRQMAEEVASFADGILLVYCNDKVQLFKILYVHHACYMRMRVVVNEMKIFVFKRKEVFLFGVKLH